MTEEDRRAAEIQKAMVARSRADADEENANGKKLDRLLSFLDDMKTKFGARLDALEAPGGGDGDGADDDEDEDGTGKTGAEDKAKRTAADSADSAAALAEVQSKYDELSNCFGKKIGAPLIAEKVLAYRKRCLRQFQQYADSAEVRAIDISKIVDLKTLAAIEQGIIRDAREAARHPAVEKGKILEVRRADASGRMVSTFYSDGASTFIPSMCRRAMIVKSILRSPR
jgi:hypothetical protein